jgi:hypothetical protein
MEQYEINDAADSIAGLAAATSSGVDEILELLEGDILTYDEVNRIRERIAKL